MILRDHDLTRRTATSSRLSLTCVLTKCRLTRLSYSRGSKEHRFLPFCGSARRSSPAPEGAGEEVKPGTMIKYVVVKGEKAKIRDRVKLDAVARQDECDANYYIENRSSRQ